MGREEDIWKTVWAGWVLYFAVAERQALKSKNPRAPLSYFLRRTLGVRRKPVTHRAGQVALGAGLVWLVTHIYDQVTPD